MILALHGWKQSPERFERKSGITAAFTKHQICYPRAPRLNWPHRDSSYRILTEAEFYFGFSDGAQMIHNMLANYCRGQTVSGVIMASGSIRSFPDWTPPCECCRPWILVTAGKHDWTPNGIDEAMEIYNAYQMRGYKVSALFHDGGHEWHHSINQVGLELVRGTRTRLAGE